MTQPTDPNQPQQPPPPPPQQIIQPAPLDYQTPQRPASKNRWWMVLLRILAGIAAGMASGGMGLWLADITNTPLLFLAPPCILFGVLLFICIKYRRFGYLTGFVMAPFLAAIALFVLILMICGGMRHP